MWCLPDLSSFRPSLLGVAASITAFLGVAFSGLFGSAFLVIVFSFQYPVQNKAPIYRGHEQGECSDSTSSPEMGRLLLISVSSFSRAALVSLSSKNRNWEGGREGEGDKKKYGGGVPWLVCLICL